MKRLVWLLPLALWCALVAILVPRHEPWFDEVHAWMLAKGSSLVELLADRMRYEGTPGLWHLLLWPFAHAGLPVEAMQWLGAFFAAGFVAVLLFRSPLPWPVKLLVPFSYFAFYQYAVVARSYCLMFLCTALVAMAWRTRAEKPGWLAAALALLAHVSTHGLLIAMGGALATALDLGNRWLVLGEEQQRRARRAAAVFGGLVALLVVQLWPHADAAYSHDKYASFELRIEAVWRMIDGALSGNVAVTLAVLIASAVWFAHRRTLTLWLCTSVPLLLLYATVIARPWHEGAFFAAWLLSLWVSFDGAPRRSIAAGAVTVAATIALAVQLDWSMRQAVRDYHETYSGARAAGRFLSEHGLDREPLFGLGFAAFTVLPYTHAKTFVNAQDGRPYWLWTKKEMGLLGLKEAIRQQPELVVRAKKAGIDDSKPLAGYSLVAAFPGSLLFKGGVIEPDTVEVLRRLPSRSASQ